MEKANIKEEKRFLKISLMGEISIGFTHAVLREQFAAVTAKAEKNAAPADRGGIYSVVRAPATTDSGRGRREA